MHEQWTFNYQDRIFPTPVITLPIVESAIEELEWVVSRGARIVLIRPAPVPGYEGHRSFALPEFDPFWEKVVEADVAVGMHASDDGIDAVHQRLGGHTAASTCPFGPRARSRRSSAATTEGSWTLWGRRSATACSSVSRSAGAAGRERLAVGGSAAWTPCRTPTSATPTCSTKTRWPSSSATCGCTRSTRTTPWTSFG